MLFLINRNLYYSNNSKHLLENKRTTFEKAIMAIKVKELKDDMLVSIEVNKNYYLMLKNTLLKKLLIFFANYWNMMEKFFGTQINHQDSIENQVQIKNS